MSQPASRLIRWNLPTPPLACKSMTHPSQRGNTTETRRNPNEKSCSCPYQKCLSSKARLKEQCDEQENTKHLEQGTTQHSTGRQLCTLVLIIYSFSSFVFLSGSSNPRVSPVERQLAARTAFILHLVRIPTNKSTSANPLPSSSYIPPVWWPPLFLSCHFSYVSTWTS